MNSSKRLRTVGYPHESRLSRRLRDIGLTCFPIPTTLTTNNVRIRRDVDIYFSCFLVQSVIRYLVRLRTIRIWHRFALHCIVLVAIKIKHVIARLSSSPFSSKDNPQSTQKAIGRFHPNTVLQLTSLPISSPSFEVVLLLTPLNKFTLIN